MRRENFDDVFHLALAMCGISGVEERGAIDPAGDREREMHAEPQAFGIEPDRFVEIDRADRHVMEAGRRVRPAPADAR